MNTKSKIALTLVVGVALGAAAVQGLHAQAKPPVYVIAEIDISNPDAYAKEFLSPARSMTGLMLSQRPEAKRWRSRSHERS